MRKAWRQSLRVGIVAGLAALTVSACASRDQAAETYSNQSAPLQFEALQGDDIDLLTLIDPENRRSRLPDTACAAAEADTQSESEERRRAALGTQVECALIAFRTYSLSASAFSAQLSGGDDVYSRAARSPALAIRRNDIQDRLMLRSDVLCREFERRMNIDLRIEGSSGLSGIFGNQGRLVGEVGSALIGDDLFDAFTNATGMSDPATLQLDQEQIEKLILRIATDGIARARADLAFEIEEARRLPLAEGGINLGNSQGPTGLSPITVYSLERALAVALKYHATCSVRVGLLEAERRLSRPENTQDNDLQFPNLLPQ